MLLTPEDYETILKSQDYKCAICKSSDPSGGRTHFSVDHDHTSGEVRGLLCGKCNTSLGKVKDSTELLERMLTYLGN